MNFRPIFAALAISASFAGCATFSDQELGTIRQSGVSPAVVGKFEQSRVLTPDDVIALSRRHVPDELIIRQIQDAGVDYVLEPRDIKRMANARVSKNVAVALIMASDDFAGQYAPQRRARPSVDFSVGPDYDYGYGDGYPYYYGGPTVIVGGGYYHHHHHWH